MLVDCRNITRKMYFFVTDVVQTRKENIKNNENTCDNKEKTGFKSLCQAEINTTQFKIKQVKKGMI